MERGKINIVDVFIGLCFIALVISVFVFVDQFISITKAYPYLMGFLKFGILATFGEALKTRITTGSWKISRLGFRACVWGIFGCWITAIFPIIAGGVQALIANGMWPGQAVEDGLLKKFWIAFSMSLWINVLSGYAWTMMLSHEWCNKIIETGRKLGSVEFAQHHLDLVRWFKTVPLTVLWFWLPMHTITFCLPPEWRILFAAGLSVALGTLLTFSARKNPFDKK